MRTLLLPLLLSVCTAQVDENEFLLGKQRGLEAPNFVVDGDLGVGGAILSWVLVSKSLAS